jgi:hypothetical protein
LCGLYVSRRSLAIASPAPVQGPDAGPEPVAPGALAKLPPGAVIGTGCGPEAGTDSRKIVSCGKPSLAESRPLRKTIRRNPATRFPVTESRFQSHFNHQGVAPRQASASRRLRQSVPAGTNRRGSSKYPSNRADIPAGRCLGWMFRMCALPGDCTACGVCLWRLPVASSRSCRRVRVAVFVSPRLCRRVGDDAVLAGLRSWDCYACRIATLAGLLRLWDCNASMIAAPVGLLPGSVMGSVVRS